MSTSTSSLVQRLFLEVRSADSATEIFIIDGQFNLRERGIGQLRTQLEPGLYKVKVRAGFQTLEKHVLLRDRDEVMTIPPFSFVSPAPLAETSKTHESHIEAARDGSSSVDLSVGHGSFIFIFARDWTSDVPPKSVASSYPNPARGLSLREADGDRRVIADLTTQGEHYYGWEPWASCNIEVDPGCYNLSLELPSGERIEQTVVASAGWQTQVCLLQRAYGEGPDQRRADLQGAAILLSRPGHWFDPNSENLRLAELARLGLANARRVLSTEVRQMLDEKFENPMLGIFAAHLLLLDKEPDLRLLHVVVNNLRNLLSDEHPDVKALELQLNASAQVTFALPPMLRKSWECIVSATAQRPEIIPENSLAARVATHLWGSDPWLIWVKEAQPGSATGVATSARDAAPEPSNVEAILQGHLRMTRRERAIRPPTDPSSSSPFAAISKMRAERKRSVPRSAMPRAMSSALPSPTTPAQNDLSEEEINKLVQSLNIPRANLVEIIKKLKTSAAEPAGMVSEPESSPAESEQ